MLSWRIKIYPIISAVAAVVCTAAGFYFTWLVPHVNIMQWTQLILAYGVITLGCVMNIPLGRTNDISYGVYIYAWPVQQILVLLGSVSLGLAANIVLDVVLTFGLAFVETRGETRHEPGTAPRGYGGQTRRNAARLRTLCA